MSEDLPNIPKLGKTARPWDLLNPSIGRVSKEVSKSRMDACLGCEFLFKLSRQCRKCGCLMDAKTKLPHATCPIGKWGAAEPEGNEK
jgi:hypothetical protein